MAIPLIVNQGDWISRTKTARDLLVGAYGYRANEFVTIDDSLRNDGICLGWHHAYPRSWRDSFRGRPLSWLAESAIPTGLTLYWPDGIDITGEGYDADDPIFVLSDVMLWENLTDEDVKAMLGKAA